MLLFSTSRHWKLNLISVTPVWDPLVHGVIAYWNLKNMEEMSGPKHTICVFMMNTNTSYMSWWDYIINFWNLKFHIWEIFHYAASSVFLSMMTSWQQHYWPFVRRNHWSLVNSTQIGPAIGSFKIPLLSVQTSFWINNSFFGDMRIHQTHVTSLQCSSLYLPAMQASQTNPQCNAALSPPVQPTVYMWILYLSLDDHIRGYWTQ